MTDTERESQYGQKMIADTGRRINERGSLTRRWGRAKTQRCAEDARCPRALGSLEY